MYRSKAESLNICGDDGCKITVTWYTIKYTSYSIVNIYKYSLKFLSNLIFCLLEYYQIITPYSVLYVNKRVAPPPKFETQDWNLLSLMNCGSVFQYISEIMFSNAVKSFTSVKTNLY